MPTPALLKIRIASFEVRQGDAYVSIDRARIDAVSLHSGVVTVRYKEGGEVALDCTTTAAADLQGLLRKLEVQCDRNHAQARLVRKQEESAVILLGLF